MQDTTAAAATLVDPAGLDGARPGSGTHGLAWAAADEPVRVESPEMASKEATHIPAAPGLHAAVGDRELAVRITETQRAVRITGGQLEAMARKDAER